MAKSKSCNLCNHPYHIHPDSPYAESSRCGYEDEDSSEECRCRGGKTERFEGWIDFGGTLYERGYFNQIMR